MVFTVLIDHARFLCVLFRSLLCMYLWSWRSWEPRKTLRMRICTRMSCSSAVRVRKASVNVNVRTGGPLGRTGLKPLLPSRPDPSKSCHKTDRQIKTTPFNQRLKPQVTSLIQTQASDSLSRVFSSSDKRRTCEQIQICTPLIK